MKYISLSNDRVMKLPFYLAMEEYVAKYYDFDEAFFMWQVEPTVIFGRNQLIENEVNLEYCETHGINVYLLSVVIRLFTARADPCQWESGRRWP